MYSEYDFIFKIVDKVATSLFFFLFINFLLEIEYMLRLIFFILRKKKLKVADELTTSFLCCFFIVVYVRNPWRVLL